MGSELRQRLSPCSGSFQNTTNHLQRLAASIFSEKHQHFLAALTQGSERSVFCSQRGTIAQRAQISPSQQMQREGISLSFCNLSDIPPSGDQTEEELFLLLIRSWLFSMKKPSLLSPRCKFATERNSSETQACFVSFYSVFALPKENKMSR